MVQFWYSDETSSIVAREAVGAAMGGGIACLACPSLFRHLRAEAPGARTHLLEYDPRFEVCHYAPACQIKSAFQSQPLDARSLDGHITSTIRCRVAVYD